MTIAEIIYDSDIKTKSNIPHHIKVAGVKKPNDKVTNTRTNAPIIDATGENEDDDKPP